MSLAKALLDVLDDAGSATDTIEVQFNPTSLSIQMSNSVDGAESRARQDERYIGSSSTTLSLDLEFDTADEGTDVRELTAQVNQFMLPPAGSKTAPPHVGFRWGTFNLSGTMTSYSENLDLFTADGAPVRAKVSVSIREQDSRFSAGERGPGAGSATGAAVAGGIGLGLGASIGVGFSAGLGLGVAGGIGVGVGLNASVGLGVDVGGSAGAGVGFTAGAGVGLGLAGVGVGADMSAQALEGEAAADFMVRQGMDPAVWRTVAGQVADPLSIPAGTSIDFSLSASQSTGLGVANGHQAGLAAPDVAAVGLQTGGLTAGFALAASGGAVAAAQQAAGSAASTAANQARDSFGGTSTQATSSPPISSAPPVPPGRSTTTATGTTGPAKAASPPLADPRATSFGAGVPLRDRIRTAEPVTWPLVGTRRPVADVPVAANSTTSSYWEALPADGGGAVGHHPRARCRCLRCHPVVRRGRS